MKTLKLSGNMRVIALDAQGQSIPETVDEAIERSIDGTAEGRERMKALKAVKWVLRSGSMYVGPVNPSTLETPLVTDRAQALVFDGRDNHETRGAFFSRLFSAPFTAELL